MNINSLSIYSYEFEKIYVGFSGGADSTALLLLLQAAATNSSQNTFKYEAIHFEHGLRGEESKQDAEWCRKFCEERKIPLQVVNFNMNPDGDNIESEARRLRFEYWSENVDPITEAVALGHHADDKIENLLLRMMRGSNSTGLTALRKSRKIDGVTILRPLLDFRRAEIEEFLHSEGVSDWCEDSTNKELKQRRAIIRNAILPEMQKHFPDCDKAMLKSLSALQKDADFIENEAENRFNKLRGKRSVELEIFSEMPSALLNRVVRLWLSYQIGEDYVPSADFMQRFEHELLKAKNAIVGGERKSVPVLSSSAVYFEKGMVSYEQEFETVVMNLNLIIWDWRKKPTVKYGGYEFTAFLTDSLADSFFNEKTHFVVCFDADAFPENIIIRPRESGDEMIPFKRENNVAVKKLLEDTNLTTEEKTKIPVLTDPDGKILWIPGVRRGDSANIEIDKNCEIQKGNFLILKAEKETGK